MGKNMEFKKGIIIENKTIAPDVFSLRLKGEFKGRSGQFYMIKIEEGYNSLPRPISIHEIKGGEISFLYKIKGKGTKKLSTEPMGKEIELFGPLGNGFDIEEIQKGYERIGIVSGGIGIAPMRQLLKELDKEKVDLYCGFEVVDYSVENVEKYVNSKKISTVSGKIGVKGFITDVLSVENYDLIITCGPGEMMKKIIKDCLHKKVECMVLMENYMACGVGACLGCTCETSNGRKKVCKDGPVFKGKELNFSED